MKYKFLEKVKDGNYLSQYHIHYETVDNRPKTYEIVSRDHHIKNLEELHNARPDAVVMIMENPAHDKILLNKEYRMAVGEWVYNFPAGLIEDGELLEVAADRELYEETGLHIVHIEEILGESYTAVGLTNEKTVLVLGVADGNFQPSSTTMEEIEAGWFSKEEVRELLKYNKFSARTQIYLYLWSKK